MFNYANQPHGYSEPRYDEIDGLAWAWNGGGHHVEQVLGSGMIRHRGEFTGWENTYTAGDGVESLRFFADRRLPQNNGDDFAIEYIAEFITRQTNSVQTPMVLISNGTFPTGSNAIGYGIGANTGGIQGIGAANGFQNYPSGLAPSTGWHHFVASRFRGRFWYWLKRYANGAITRNLDAAPPSQVASFTGSPSIYLLKSATDTDAVHSRIAMAAVYNRGIHPDEGEDRILRPWALFRDQYSRIAYFLPSGGTNGTAPAADLPLSVGQSAAPATGGGLAPSANLSLSLALSAPSATGAALAPGTELPLALALSVSPAVVAGAGTAPAANLPVLLGFALSPATGQVSGTAPAAHLPLSLSLTSGATVGGAFAPSVSLPLSLALSVAPATATGSGVAPSANLPLSLGFTFNPAIGAGSGLAPAAHLALSLGFDLRATEGDVVAPASFLGIVLDGVFAPGRGVSSVSLLPAGARATNRPSPQQGARRPPGEQQ
jgi:hypothetical protein